MKWFYWLILKSSKVTNIWSDEIRWKFYFCVQMEKTGNLKYLKGITIILMIVNVFFVFMNLLKGIWDWAFHFGDGGWGPFLHFANYLGKSYFVVYTLIYILEIIFILILNRLLRKQRIGKGKGYHPLIVLLSFLPVVNLFLFYILKRRLNKQVFAYSELNVVKSDRKIVAIWILMILLVIYIFILVPFLTFYVNVPELVSGAAYYSHISILVADCCFLAISFTWFLYYLEFKRMLDKVDLMHTQINDNALLDS